ncbi:antitoxin [Haloferula sp. A504]|uniref:antitoxin n=1 Tax=Haloferula sp. A504 TaxID=3373601 RepID=UPI0031CB9D20|nr:hypothetical protein [Verrucomicrobiaceae bacterium E54]
MIRTQIQLPESLYREAKQLCEARELSMAELARRGLEHMVMVLNSKEKATPWAPPQPQALGWAGFSEEKLKSVAQEGSTEQNAVER